MKLCNFIKLFYFNSIKKKLLNLHLAKNKFSALISCKNYRISSRNRLISFLSKPQSPWLTLSRTLKRCPLNQVTIFLYKIITFNHISFSSIKTKLTSFHWLWITFLSIVPCKILNFKSLKSYNCKPKSSLKLKWKKISPSKIILRAQWVIPEFTILKRKKKEFFKNSKNLILKFLQSKSKKMEPSRLKKVNFTKKSKYQMIFKQKNKLNL